MPELPLDHLARCYITIVRYEDRIELDNIRLRLLYVAFYRLKKSLKDYPGAVSSIADALLSTGLIKDPIDIVRDRVTLWTRRGDRYDLLAKDLGGLGVLYILPDLGGESMLVTISYTDAQVPNVYPDGQGGSRSQQLMNHEFP